MFGSLALVTMFGVNPYAIRTFFISTIFRFIFSVGLEYTLWLLGACNVSTCDCFVVKNWDSQNNQVHVEFKCLHLKMKNNVIDLRMLAQFFFWYS